MRHRKRNVKLGRTAEERKALLASLVCNFIEEQRISTTVQKAKQARSLAEKMVTLAKDASADPSLALAARRKAVAVLRDRRRVKKLFDAIAPQYKERAGGYTRIVHLGRRGSDGADMALLEWVNLAPVDRRRKPKDSGEKKTDETKTSGEEKKQG